MKGKKIMDSSLEFLCTRRSVRSYRPDEIPGPVLSEVLQAAKFAPSTLGFQGRHFTVVRSRGLIEEIVEATRLHGGNFLPGQVPFYGAPTVVVLSAPKNYKFNREDAACAAMYLMLAAHARGLASCYVCSVLPGLNDPKILEQLNLPKNYVPFGSVCIGYAAGEIPQPRPRRTDDVTFL